MPTILVTGANRGIGLELVRQYASDSWDVLACARTPENAPDLAALAAKHPKIEIQTLDVADEDSIEDLVDHLDGRAIDLLLSNAGTYPREGTHIGELDYDSWRETFETNLFGVMRLNEAFLENVEDSERKQIAAISSAMGSIRGVSGGSVAQSGTSYQYRTSKTALNMALSILAKELEPRGISVVMLCPGWVKTDMGGSGAMLTPEQSVTGMKKVLDAGRMDISGKFLGYDGAIRPW